MPGNVEGMPEAAPLRRVVAVVNPATRRDAAAIVDLLRRAAPPTVELDIRLTTAPGAAVALARAARVGADAVVAVGGDGTVADVATGLHGSGVPLGIIPAGSTNIIARELRIPVNPRAAVALLFGRHAYAIRDLGLCGDRCFLHIAGAGFDSRLFAATNPALKRRLGWLAYLPPAARHLLAPPSRVTILADGETIAAVSPLVLVANGGSIIRPGLRLYPDIRADDGWLDVLIFTAVGPLPTMRTLGRFGTRRLNRSPYVLRRRARQVDLTADPPLPVQLDGDVVAETPATFTIAPAALRVIVPPG